MFGQAVSKYMIRNNKNRKNVKLPNFISVHSGFNGLRDNIKGKFFVNENARCTFFSDI
jgi:hypothetical protein